MKKTASELAEEVLQKVALGTQRQNYTFVNLAKKRSPDVTLRRELNAIIRGTLAPTERLFGMRSGWRLK